MGSTSISVFHLYIGMILSGLFTGVGVAIGTYLVNKYLIKKTEKMIGTLENNVRLLRGRIDKIKK